MLNRDELSQAIELQRRSYNLLLWGRSVGPAVLALWREIAWTTTAPRKNFVLHADDIVRAEESLAGAIAGANKTTP